MKRTNWKPLAGTAAFAVLVGTAILWAALLGAIMKFVMNEGLTRWQLATGSTLLEGWVQRLPRVVSIYFFIYLLIWSFIVAGALIAGTGLAAHALFPGLSVEVWGVVHSLAALMLVYSTAGSRLVSGGLSLSTTAEHYGQVNVVLADRRDEAAEEAVADADARLLSGALADDCLDRRRQLHSACIGQRDQLPQRGIPHAWVKVVELSF